MCQKVIFEKDTFWRLLSSFFFSLFLTLFLFINLGSTEAATLNISCESGCEILSLNNHIISVSGEDWEKIFFSYGDVILSYYNQYAELINLTYIMDLASFIIDNNGYLTGTVVIPWLDCQISAVNLIIMPPWGGFY